jgi:hypothetical protein
MAAVADLSALEREVAESEKNVAALIARANELAAQAPVEPIDPIDPIANIDTSLGLPAGGGGGISRPAPDVTGAPLPSTAMTMGDDKSINLTTVALVMGGAFLIYKFLK